MRGSNAVLLDIIPFELTEADKAQGLTEKSPAWRNRFAENGLAGVVKAKPAAFYTKKNASMIRTGNLEDHLAWLADVDWVIEVVIENLKIKQELFAKVEKVVRPECIVTTNTSGIPIKDISAKFGPKLKAHFLGTHFFNPPRYMKLLEIIPGAETKPEVVAFMTRFCEEVAGEGRRHLQGCTQLHRQPDRRVRHLQCHSPHGRKEPENRRNGCHHRQGPGEAGDVHLRNAGSGRTRYGPSRHEEPLCGGSRRRDAGDVRTRRNS